MLSLKRIVLTFFTLIMLVNLGCDSAQKDFDKANKENTEQAYRKFLEKHGDHPLAEEAKRHLELVLFESAIQSNDKKMLKDFLAEFPEGERYSEAKERLDQLLLESTQINGRIYRSDSSKPLSNVEVFLKEGTLEAKKVLDTATMGLLYLTLVAHATNEIGIVSKTRTDKNGYYSFTKVKPGLYFILARVETNNNRMNCSNNGWFIAGATKSIGTPGTSKYTSLSFLAALGKIFDLKVGEQIEMNINLECK